jgi:hypothetical protein
MKIKDNEPQIKPASKFERNSSGENVAAPSSEHCCVNYLDHFLPVLERVHGRLREHDLAVVRINVHLLWTKCVVLNKTINQYVIAGVLDPH